MSENSVQRKINNVQKGCRIIVIPKGKQWGDNLTLIGYPCAEESEAPFEIREPFEAVFEDFDGGRLKLRTPRYYCFTVSIEEVKNIQILNKESRGCL